MKQLDICIDGRYRLVAKLGEGTFGLVYQGVDIRTDDAVAIKLEHVSTDPSILAGEVETYQALRGSLGIPRIYWDGSECEYNVMVLELLGPNLEDLYNYCGRVFSLKTVLLLADQLLRRLQLLHKRDVVHRDIKPENFLMGRGRRGNQVFVTDLGLAWSENARTSLTSNSLLGTARYASINGHLGKEQSEFDDLESLGYMLVYFLRGSLPWQSLSAASRADKESRILEMKRKMTPEQLCQDLPSEFVQYMKHVRERKELLPSYAALRRAFKTLFIRSKFEHDHVFDWTLLKFLEQADKEALISSAKD